MKLGGLGSLELSEDALRIIFRLKTERAKAADAAAAD